MILAHEIIRATMVSPSPEPEVRFEIRAFDQLALRDLHDLLALRARIFVVEQASPYLDPDGRDPVATHLLGRLPGGEIVACARWLEEAGDAMPPGAVRLGRIVLARELRGRGWGARLVEAALAGIHRRLGPRPVVLDSQTVQIPFYERFGFVARGPEWDDVGILHRFMVRPADRYR